MATAPTARSATSAVHATMQLADGMTFAIEPMITVGSPEVYVHDDDWSISTSDSSLAAHFEHTIAVTDGGQLSRMIQDTAIGSTATMSSTTASLIGCTLFSMEACSMKPVFGEGLAQCSLD